MPAGRPSKVDQVIGRDAAGQPVTVSDRIIQALRAGNFVEEAAAAAGINKTTIYEWLLVGARAANDVAEGRIKRSKLTKYQRRLIEFSNSVAQADGEWVVGTNATLERLGRGGVEQVTVRETVTLVRDANGVPTGEEEVQRVTTTSRSMPNSAVLMWRLARRSAKYGRPMFDSGGADEPAEQRVGNLMAKVLELQAAELPDDDDINDDDIVDAEVVDG